MYILEQMTTDISFTTHGSEQCNIDAMIKHKSTNVWVGI